MNDKKTNVLSTLSSFNTLLNDFPSLLSIEFVNVDDDINGVIYFLLDLSKLFGMSEKKLLKWISEILTDDDTNKTRKSILNVIEEAIKAALLLHFNSLYTNCETSPIIPDDFLRYSYTYKSQKETNAKGITVRVPSIDMFSLLKFYPLGETGQMFYFDVNSDGVNQPKYLYRSCDFNAWLWWVMNYTDNKSSSGYPWDNRVHYIEDFKGNDGQANRELFVESHIGDSPLYKVGNIGKKKHIISAYYQEIGTTLNNSNVLHVFGCAETYKTDIPGLNKSVFEFNADYIYSLKLFDSKTLTAQVINALTGLAGAMFGMFSLEVNVLIKKVEKTVEKVISKPIKVGDEGYFIFSEEEYNDIVNDATLRYNGEYATHNDTNDNVVLNVTEITNAIKKIDGAETNKEKEEAITYSIKALCDSTKEYSIGINTPFTQQKDIIMKFIKEIVTQISLQMLTPKVMLLFAINDYFLSNKNNVQIDIEGFMKNFWNIISSCIMKISELILQSLLDMVLGYIRPILVLVVEKLLLETLTYYKELLTDLLSKCLIIPTFGFNFGNLVIDNVNYADIIPQKTEP